MKVIGTSTAATWTSATAADTAVTLDVSNYAGALVTYTKTGTVSAGTIVFEFSDDDGTTWYTVKVARLSTQATESSYTLTTGSTSWIANVPGATDFRVRLSVQISGAGSASLRVANLALTTPFPGSSAGGGGGDGAILDGADSGIAATVLDLTNSNPLTVAITDASGTQITSFGGGTQYTEGDTDASITGTAMLMEVAANALQPVQGTVADGLLVNLGANNDVTVSGVSTSANQTTIIGHLDGVEGLLTTIDADTGNISTKIDTIAAAIKAEDVASAGGDSGMVIHAIRKATPANQSGSDGDYEPLQVSAGRLWTSTTVTSGTLTSISTIGECSDVRQFVPSRLQGQVQGTETVDGTILSAPVAIGAYASSDPTDSTVDTNGDLQHLKTDLNGRLWVTADSSAPVQVANSGSFAVQESGSALTALQLIDDTVFADDAAFTVGTSKVTAVGMLADESSTDSVNEGDVGCPRMTLDRKVIVSQQPHTAGGLSIFRSIDLDESEEEIKASAGCVYGMWVTNTATSTRWIKFYNATAASVTVGTTTPVITWGIPGNSSDDISGLFGSGNGIEFTTAITVAATTGVADADTGAPGANEVIINVFYK